MTLLNVCLVVSMPLLTFSAITFPTKQASLGLVLLPELSPIWGILNNFSEVLFIYYGTVLSGITFG